MKARVKVTGEIIEVERVGIASDMWALQSDSTVVFSKEELDINLEPDYWEKLKHQYTGMFLAGMLANSEWEGTHERLSEIAIDYAIALVNRLKEEER